MSCYFDKVPFPSESMARAEADRINRSSARRHEIVAFLCQNCGSWHVGGKDAEPKHFLVRMSQRDGRYPVEVESLPNFVIGKRQ